MSRLSVLALSLLACAACARTDGGPDVPVVDLVGGAAPLAYLGRTVFSPDGRRIAYARQLEGVSAIFVANADGSDPVRLTHGVWDQSPSWSPDGAWIAYYSDDDADVWVVPSGGGEPRPLTAGPANDDPRGWLPDGSGVVFYRTGPGDTRTLVAPLDGGAARPLFDAPAGNVAASPSPDGARYVYVLVRGGRSTLWVQDTAGGPARQLTTDGFEDFRSPQLWSPDGRFILYTTGRTGTTDVWRLDVETGEQRQLTDDIRNDFDAAWSPDGRWVAFLSDRGGQRDLWIVSADGGPAHRVTADLDQEDFPVWAPDGRHIVYQMSKGVVSINVMAAAGGAARSAVTLEGYTINELSLSADGRTILYSSNRSGNVDIWSVPLAGGEPTPFAVSPLNDGQPRFSPDGSQVAFGSNRRGATADVWVMPATGGEPRQLTDWPSQEAPAAWSPDGRTLAFTSNRDATRFDLWTIAAAGGAAKRITHGNFGINATDVRWSPDGRTLYFIGASADGSGQVFSVAAAGGTPRQLTHARGNAVDDPDVSPDGAQLTYQVIARGLSYVETVPLTGGLPRPFHADTTRAYQDSPRWSPDGSRIVFSDWNFATDHYNLALVALPGGEVRRLTTTTDRFEFDPTWTHGGDSLVFISVQAASRVRAADVSRLLGPPR